MTLGASQINGIQTNNLTIETDEDWLTYEPISDPSLNSSQFEMLVDSTNNVHLFWSSKNSVENNSRLIHEIRYTNGSTLNTNVVEITNETIYFNYEVDIDNLDQIHLVIRNNTGNMMHYYVGSDGTWEVISEVSIEINNYCVVVDNSENVHIIYSGYDGNIYEKVYSNNEWQEEQITNYETTEDNYVVSYFFEKAKSLQEKIAVLYGYSLNSELLGVDDIDQLHCLIFDEVWSEPIVIADNRVIEKTIAYDDIEKLHIIWSHKTNPTDVNYQTYKKNKWSTISEIRIFESAVASYGYYSLFNLNLETQGATLLLAYTASLLLNPIGFDYDLFVAQSNDGETWTSEPVYTNNLTRSTKPLIESTKDGDVYVLALEKGYGDFQNMTIYFGYDEDHFTYQTTAVPLKLSILICAIPIIVYVYRKKTK